jgi:hypothetical protein
MEPLLSYLNSCFFPFLPFQYWQLIPKAKGNTPTNLTRSRKDFLIAFRGVAHSSNERGQLHQVKV